MPRSDRVWWVRSLFALALAAASVFLSTTIAYTALPLAAYGESITGDLLFALATFPVFLAMSIGFAISSINARQRARLRLRALSGDATVMSWAAVSAHADHAPDLSAAPLVLEWHATKSTRVLYTLFVGVVLLGVAVLDAVVGGFGIAELIGHVLSSQWDGMTASEAVAVLFCLLLFIGIIIFAVRVFPFLFGRPYGVTANAEGIQTRGAFGSRRSIQWGEAQLFEVVAKSRYLSARSYYLAGLRSWVLWQDDPTEYDQVAPYGISASEMAERLQALVDLIAARTSLQPRTFSKALKPREASAERMQRSNQRGVFIGMVILSLITLGIAALVPITRVTPYQVLNGAVAGSLGFAAIVLLFAGVRLLTTGTSRPSKDSGAGILVDLPSVSDLPGVIYEHSVGIGAWGRVVAALCGLILTVNLLPGLLYLASMWLGSILPSDLLPTMPTDSVPILAYVTGVYGFFGAMVLILGIRGTRSTVQLSSASLSSARITLLLENVGGIFAVQRGGVTTKFQVLDGDRVPVFAWAARPTTSMRPSSPAFQAVSADELAALVAKRTGKTIERRDIG